MDMTNQEYGAYFNKHDRFSLIRRIIAAFVHKSMDWTQAGKDSGSIISYLQWRYYGLRSAELDAEMDYQTALLEYTKVRYERGLIPDEDLHDAEFELELLKIDRSVLLLEGLSLETEINMHIL